MRQSFRILLFLPSLSWTRIAALYALLLIPCSGAHAVPVSIFDTSGVLRAEQDVADGSSSVQFSAVNSGGDPAQSIEVVLTNQSTGETILATMENGTVVFESVAPGSWTVSTAAPGITFTQVSIAPAAFAGGLAGMGIGTGVIAVGGVTGVTATAIAISQNSEDEDPLSPAS